MLESYLNGLKMKKVGILFHPLKEAAQTLARELDEFLTSKGLTVWLQSAWEAEKARAKISRTDLILSIGGDGTILRAAQLVVHSSIPIVGINLGQLGFMTELTVSETRDKLPELLEGKGWIDERSLLELELSPGEGQAPRSFYALNDVVVARGAVARVIYIEAAINGEPLTTYKADGVVVSTATGSTGYALAAGGPILQPQAKELLLVPILPHLTLSYPLVLPSTAIVKLHVNPTYPATLSIDGHINMPVSDNAALSVKHSSKKVRFLRIHPEDSFYSSLERKLKGRQ
ncbi:MAG: NAD(+)/NADH kinase [Chloroflexota bacterium]